MYKVEYDAIKITKNITYSHEAYLTKAYCEYQYTLNFQNNSCEKRATNTRELIISPMLT